MALHQFKATKLWNSIVRSVAVVQLAVPSSDSFEYPPISFTQGVPLETHRSKLRTYNACFRASVGITWMYDYLRNDPNFGDHVTEGQTVRLLQKMMESGVFHPTLSGDNGRFIDGNKLYSVTQAKSENPPLCELPNGQLKPAIPRCHIMYAPPAHPRSWVSMAMRCLERATDVEPISKLINSKLIKNDNILLNLKTPYSRECGLAAIGNHALKNLVEPFKTLFDADNQNHNVDRELDALMEIIRAFDDLKDALIPRPLVRTFVDCLRLTSRLDALGEPVNVTGSVEDLIVELTRVADETICNQRRSFVSNMETPKNTHAYLAMSTPCVDTALKLPSMKRRDSFNYDSEISPIGSFIDASVSFPSDVYDHSRVTATNLQTQCSSQLFPLRRDHLLTMLHGYPLCYKQVLKTKLSGSTSALVTSQEGSLTNLTSSNRSHNQSWHCILDRGEAWNSCSPVRSPVLKSCAGSTTSISYKPCNNHRVDAIQICLLFLDPNDLIILRVIVDLFDHLFRCSKLRLSTRLPNDEALVDYLGDAVARAPDVGSQRDHEDVKQLIRFFVNNAMWLLDLPKKVIEEIEQIEIRQRRDRIMYDPQVTSNEYGCCERISEAQYVKQKRSISQQALTGLLDNIAEDRKMSPKTRKKKLKKFRSAHPDVYTEKFGLDSENVPPKGRTLPKRFGSILKLRR